MFCRTTKELGSRFLFIQVAFRRAHQLTAGARPKIPVRSGKPAYIAMKEAENNLIRYSLLVEDPDEEPSAEQELQESAAVGA